MRKGCGWPGRIWAGSWSQAWDCLEQHMGWVAGFWRWLKKLRRSRCTLLHRCRQKPGPQDHQDHACVSNKPWLCCRLGGEDPQLHWLKQGVGMKIPLLFVIVSDQDPFTLFWRLQTFAWLDQRWASWQPGSHSSWLLGVVCPGSLYFSVFQLN